MPACRCKLAKRPDRAKIEALIVGGAHITAVAKSFGLDRSQLSRHMKYHVTDEERSAFLCGTSDVIKLRKIAAEQNGTVLEDLQLARSMTFKAMHDASQAKDGMRFAALVAKFIDILDAVGRRTGEIMRLSPALVVDNRITNVTVMNAPEWLAVQRAVLTALLPYPEARAAVIVALRRMDDDERPMIEGRANG